jgi:putative transposase
LFAIYDKVQWKHVICVGERYMPRCARLVVPGIPHHITQRGNRKQKVFEDDMDKKVYLKYMMEHCREYKLDIWAYCLMPNHVHFIAVPQQDESMARVFSVCQMRYCQYYNTKYHQVGHLWQSRYYSCPMNERHTFVAVRYVENNPVRAGLEMLPGMYRWSSAPAHIYNSPDPLLGKDCPMLKEIPDWADFLRISDNEDTIERFRKSTTKGIFF